MRRIASVIVLAGLFASTATAQTPPHIEVAILFGDVRASPVFMKPTGLYGQPVNLANADPVHRPLFGMGASVHLNRRIAAIFTLASTGYKTHDIDLPVPAGASINCTCAWVFHVTLSDRDDRILTAAAVELIENRPLRWLVGGGLQIDHVVADERDAITGRPITHLQVGYQDTPLRHTTVYPVLVNSARLDFSIHGFVFGDLALRVSPNSSDVTYPTARLFPAGGLGVRF